MTGGAEETRAGGAEEAGERAGIQSLAYKEERAAPGGEKDPPSSGDGEDEF